MRGPRPTRSSGGLTPGLGIGCAQLGLADGHGRYPKPCRNSRQRERRGFTERGVRINFSVPG